MDGATTVSTETSSTSTEQTAGENTTQISGENGDGVNNYYSDMVAMKQGGRLNSNQMDNPNETQTVQSFNKPGEQVVDPAPVTEVKVEETKLSTEQQGALNTYLDALNTMIDSYEQITPQIAQEVVSDMKTANNIGSQIEKNNEGINQAKEELKNGDLGNDEKLHFIQKVAKYEVDNQSLTSQLNFLREKLDQKDIELETIKSDPFKQSMNETDKNFLGAKKGYESNKENAYYETQYVESLLSQLEGVLGESLKPAVNAIYQRKAYNFKPNATSGFNLPQAQATTENAKRDAIKEALNSIGIQ